MARKTNTFNNQLAILYQDAVDSRRFLKQQQWNVTNYAAVIYAAVLYLYSQGWLATSDGKFISVSVPLVACAANIVVLWQLQGNMTKFRDRIQWMYEKQFTLTQRGRAQVKAPRPRAGPQHCHFAHSLHSSWRSDYALRSVCRPRLASP